MPNHRAGKVRVGLAAQDVGTALPADKAITDPLTARALYASDGTRAAVWVVLDFLDFGPHIVDPITDAVRAATSVEPAHVHVVTTHNHSAVEAARLDLGVLRRGAAEAACQACACAEPASMRRATVRLTERLNYRRRLLVPELGGAVTFWYGITPAGGYRADALVRQVVRALMRDRRIIYADSGYEEPVPEEAFIDERLRRYPDSYLMPPGDPTLQAVLFKNGRGRALGSLLRYAVHVHACRRDAPYSSDFPHHARCALEDAFGGCAIFLTGPCANISPVLGHGEGADERTVGALLGSRAADALKAAPSEPLDALLDVSQPVTLPVRDDFPFEDADRERETERVRALLGCDGVPLPERKRLAERLFYLGQTATIRDLWRCPDRRHGALQRTVTVSLGLLRLNDLSLLAFPGETFWDTGAAVTAGMPPGSAMTVTEHGRTGVYLPPPDQWPLGGYESSCCLIARNAEPLLRRAATALLGR